MPSHLFFRGSETSHFLYAKYIYISGESWSTSQVMWKCNIIKHPQQLHHNAKVALLLLLLLFIIIIIFSQVFPGTFPLESMVNPTTQASRF
jgi:hypothetical protein